MPRDPVQNPKSGDIIEIGGNGSCVFRHVVNVNHRYVLFASRVGNQWFNSMMRDSLKEWRENTKNSQIVRFAEDVHV